MTTDTAIIAQMDNARMATRPPHALLFTALASINVAGRSLHAPDGGATGGPRQWRRAAVAKFSRDRWRALIISLLCSVLPGSAGRWHPREVPRPVKNPLSRGHGRATHTNTNDWRLATCSCCTSVESRIVTLHG